MLRPARREPGNIQEKIVQAAILFVLEAILTSIQHHARLGFEVIWAKIAPFWLPLAVCRLHAIDLTTGHEKNGSPSQILSASKSFQDQAVVNFDATKQLQQPGLTLAQGQVYAGRLHDLESL